MFAASVMNSFLSNGIIHIFTHTEEEKKMGKRSLRPPIVMWRNICHLVALCEVTYSVVMVVFVLKGERTFESEMLWSHIRLDCDFQTPSVWFPFLLWVPFFPFLRVNFLYLHIPNVCICVCLSRAWRVSWSFSLRKSILFSLLIVKSAFKFDMILSSVNYQAQSNK